MRPSRPFLPPVAVVVAALVALAILASARPAHAERRTVTLWHSYRGAEEQALLEVVRAFEAEQDELRVEVLSVPHEGYAAKLTTAVPRGHGPDLFIFAHERIGGWANTGILEPIGDRIDPQSLQAFFPETVKPLEYQGKVWGLPLAFKSAALFYNRALVTTPPRTTDDLFEIGRRLSGGGRYGLAYQAELFYFHAAWYFGFGARLLDAEGQIDFEAPASVASLAFVRRLQDEGIIPREASGTLVTQLFNEGKAGMVISGPWFLGEIDPAIDFAVAPLPVVSATGLPASPFLTDEAIFVSAKARAVEDALKVARRIAGKEGAVVRALTGKQVVANRHAWDDPRIGGDPVLAAFRAQLPATVPMDNRPEMRNVWEPADVGLRKVLRGGYTPERAAEAAQRRWTAITRTAPPTRSPAVYLVFVIGLVAGALAIVIRWLVGVRRRRQTAALASGWSWIAPAMIATAILLFVPFTVGLALSLFHHKEGAWSFVGLSNFVDILLARSYGPTEPLSFYYALAVTIVWTAVNITLHVGLGLALALLLNRPTLALRPIYRVLLIIPWAVPNYITALIWKGMFHSQFGAINGMLTALGLEKVSWFSSFGTAFFANVCTNAWLGFPFMMVVSLGALQSIPKDLYEAADVDGASGWDKLRHITLPLLVPALIPSVLLGIVWTFNQFNVVYLVSGGEPDNATDILISEAYRWAFNRQEQYGYAAAYAALIFVILLGWSLVSARLARAAEARA